MEEFVVSARKYRPITFESVVGQEHITSTLKNAIARKQLAHAYLFCGPRGVGKTTCARILAKTINCMNLTQSIEPCNECESCKAFALSRSFNIHELDAASNNSVDNIRSLTDQVRIPPQIGKYSVYIIDEAHMLSTAAFNAFLKTLEEPPKHAIFILATTERHKILPTILSRCQIYDFKRIKVEDMVKYLQYISDKEKINSDDESLHIISQKADGCMRDALSMYDKVVSFCGSELSVNGTSTSLNVLDYDTYFKFIDYLYNGDYTSALTEFDNVLQKGFEAQIFVNGLAGHFRNILVAKTDSTLSLLEVTGTVADRYREQAQKYNVSFIFNALNIISQCESASRQSYNQRLHTELAILKLCNITGNKVSSEVIQHTFPLPIITQSEEIKNVVIPQVTVPIQQTEEEHKKKEVVEKVELIDKTADAAKSVITPSLSMGISINNIVKESHVIKNNTPKKTVEVNEDKVIDENDIEKVLEGCYLYSEDIKKTKPRFYTIFKDVVVNKGKIEIKVPNSIVGQEIEHDKRDILLSITEYSGVSNLDLVVVVEEIKEEGAGLLLIKDEDKLKYMIEQNGEVIDLCKKLELDFV